MNLCNKVRGFNSWGHSKMYESYNDDDDDDDDEHTQ